MAVELAEQACGARREPNAHLLDVLASAYAEVGQFDRAQTTAMQALALVRTAGDKAQTQEIEQRLKGYRSGRRFRTASKVH